MTIRLSGPVAEQMERFFEHRICSPEAWDLVYREAEDAFRNRIDDASGSYGIWQGEFWGKWMIGAVQFCRYSGDEKLKKFIREGVCHLLAMQEPSGYLGTYRDPMNVFRRIRNRQKFCSDGHATGTGISGAANTRSGVCLKRGPF